MFYLRYLAAELRRRKGRTFLTATCLAFGVGLVVAVTSLSAGLDDAQSEVLEPLTGVGTEMTVTRPQEEGGAPTDAGGKPIALDNLGDAGERFDSYQYTSTNTSFGESKERSVAATEGVENTAGGLTVTLAHVSGKIPKDAAAGPTAAPAAGGASTAPPTGGVPDSINFETTTVSGVDTSNPDLGLLTQSQVTEGDYIEGRSDAVISTAYAAKEGLEVGDTVDVGKDSFDVVGISSGAVGGQVSDVYISLDRLQELADVKGRINVIQVDAASASEVDAVANRIESGLSGADVTTSSEVADQVSGSLVDAQSLSGKLGTALAIVALIGAFGITALVTLSSINKRTRELGTLKAIGWRQWLVVRQIAGESVAQGLLGGLLGAALGIGAAALIGAAGISLDASIASTASAIPGPPGAAGAGTETAAAAVNTVTLGAPVSIGMIGLAIALAVLGGLLAGGIGGLRTARLRPAEALRSLG